ncbi:MAG: PaaI family thioesterase [Rubrivivax sp.]|jgi:uncharacterized protein (TIGR00369 family)|nr:PaaI family thioesterase [Rubrivivax sp.]
MNSGPVSDAELRGFQQRGESGLPGHLGMVFTRIGGDEVRGEMPVRQELMAPNGFLHAGALVALADTCAGYGCRASVPAEATGFTTIELKTNHLATATEGTVECVARPLHAGRTTQVWDATVTHRESGRTLVQFRCTQLVLYPKK